MLFKVIFDCLVLCQWNLYRGFTKALLQFFMRFFDKAQLQHSLLLLLQVFNLWFDFFAQQDVFQSSY